MPQSNIFLPLKCVYEYVLLYTQHTLRYSTVDILLLYKQN